MNYADILTLWLTQLFAQLPEIMLCLGLCVWVLVRWRQASSGAVWALLGFGLLLLLTLLGPSIHVAQQRWIIEDAMPAKEVGAMLTVFAAIWSTLRAIAYVFLAVAIYAGRSPAPAISPPPLPRTQPPPLA